MNNDGQLRAFILRALHNAGSAPMTDDTLISAMQLAFPHLTLTRMDAINQIKACENLEMLAGTTDPILGTMYMLTPKGKLVLSSLPR